MFLVDLMRRQRLQHDLGTTQRQRRIRHEFASQLARANQGVLLIRAVDEAHGEALIDRESAPRKQHALGARTILARSRCSTA